jgi:hypothetical protein
VVRQQQGPRECGVILGVCGCVSVCIQMHACVEELQPLQPGGITLRGASVSVSFWGSLRATAQRWVLLTCTVCCMPPAVEGWWQLHAFRVAWKWGRVRQ